MQEEEGPFPPRAGEKRVASEGQATDDDQSGARLSTGAGEADQNSAVTPKVKVRPLVV